MDRIKFGRLHKLLAVLLALLLLCTLALPSFPLNVGAAVVDAFTITLDPAPASAKVTLVNAGDPADIHTVDTTNGEATFAGLDDDNTYNLTVRAERYEDYQEDGITPGAAGHAVNLTALVYRTIRFTVIGKGSMDVNGVIVDDEIEVLHGNPVEIQFVPATGFSFAQAQIGDIVYSNFISIPTVTEDLVVEVTFEDVAPPEIELQVGDQTQPATSRVIEYKVTDNVEVAEITVELPDSQGTVVLYTADPENPQDVVEGSYGVTKNGTYVFTATDAAGNTTTNNSQENEIEIENVDTEGPSFSVVSAGLNENHTQKLFEMKIEDENGVDVDSIEVLRKVEDTYVVDDSIQVSAHGVLPDTYTFTITQNGNYMLRAQDSVANNSSYTFDVTDIDDIDPVVVVDEFGNIWYNEPLEITLKVTEEGSGVDAVFYSNEMNGDALANPQLASKSAEQDKYAFVWSEDYKGDLYIQAVDKAGNASAIVVVPVQYDATPAGNLGFSYSILDADGYVKQVETLTALEKLFFKEKMLWSFTAEDALSGVATVEYRLVDEDHGSQNWEEATWDEAAQAWTVVVEYVDFEDGFVGNLYMRATDMAGNTALAELKNENGSLVLVILDDQQDFAAPTITAGQGGVAYTGDWTTGEVEIALDIPETDRPRSDIDYYEYSVTYAGGAGATEWAEVPFVNGSFVITTDDFYNVEEEAWLNATFHFRGVSNTLNRGQTSSITLRIQDEVSGQPSIAISEVNGENGWHVTSYPAIEISLVGMNEHAAGFAVYYKLWNDDDPDSDGNAVYALADVEPVIDADGRWVLEAWAEDMAQNKSPVQRKVLLVDLTAPEDLDISYEANVNNSLIKKILNKVSFNLFFREEIILDFEAADATSKINRFEYLLAGPEDELADAIDAAEWRAAELNSDGVSATATVEWEEFSQTEKGGFEGRIYLRVWDDAGNVSYAVLTNDENGEPMLVVLDNAFALEGPQIATAYTEGSWENGPATLVLSGAETLSGVDYYEYYVQYPGDPEPGEDEEDGDVEWTMVPETDGSVVHAEANEEGPEFIANQLTVSTGEFHNGPGGFLNATLYFRAVSNTGLESAASSIHLLLQDLEPENADITISAPDGNNNWYRLNLPRVEIAPWPREEYSAPIQTWYKLWNTTTGGTEQKAATVEFTGNNAPNITGDGVWQLRVWTTDAAGNQSVQFARTLYVDRTAPTQLTMTVAGESILARRQNSAAFQLFYNANTAIQLGANFDISGLASLQYQKAESLGAVNQNAWQAYPSGGIVARPNEKFILYMRAEDRAGNVTILHSEGIIVDDQPPVGERLAPEITIVPEAANQNGYYNGNVSVDITVYDPPYSGTKPDSADGVYSGLASIHYRVLVGDTVTKDSTRLFPSSAYRYGTDADGLVQSWNGAIVIDSAENNSNDVVVEIVAVDNAGNERITRTQPGDIKIDITAPTIRVEYDNNDSDEANSAFFDADRTATIYVTERNFNGGDMVVSITNTEGAVPGVSEWSMQPGSAENGDDTVYAATVVFTEDGDYTLELDYTDLAGNHVSSIEYNGMAPQEFTIDKTEPIINVSFDNNSAANGKYFDAGRTMTIEIEEHNFAEDRVEITTTGALGGSGVAAPTAVSWSTSGDIHVATLNFDADGDYTFDITMRDMAGNENQPVNYGSSVAYDEFTVDTEIDSLEITGVEDGAAYRDTLVPAVQFNDVNFDSYELTLTRTRLAEHDKDVSGDFLKAVPTGSQGGSASFDSFEKLQDNDGIYTLTLTVYDLAGNEETEEVTFSANRFGSVYVFSEVLTALQDAYVQAVPGSLVITEYNPDPLVEGSPVVEVARDNAPLAEVDYTISPVPNSAGSTGTSGWYEYDYTIAASNFAEDGIYSVSVASEDVAGNKPETLNYDDKAVLFRVDSTPPEVASVTGLENSSYNAASINVDFTAFDAIGLDRVDVYVNGSLVQSFTEIEDPISFTGSFAVGEGLRQNVQFVLHDKAGNITDTNLLAEDEGFPFARTVTVSTNVFIRWYANTPLFVGSIVAVVVLVAAIVALVVLKKRKKAVKEEK